MKMEVIEIFGKKYGFCRSPRCSYGDKMNRMVKLAYQFEELSLKMDGLIERGKYVTDTARCAMACKMMMYTGIRIGNEGSAEGYVTKPHPNSKKEPEFVQTYGLTTLLPEHCVVDMNGDVRLNFLGKKQVENTFTVKGDLAIQLREVLKTVEEGETVFEVTVRDLTRFIKKYVGVHFTPKDFRTMRANMVAYEKFAEICKRPKPKTKTEFNANIKEIAEYVSEHLNNTPGVCKKSYIDAELFLELGRVCPVTKR